MPTYDYECNKCGEVFEMFHAMSANPEVHCEKCGGDARKKVGGGSGLIFKGSGFYVTDYKKSSGNKGCSCPNSGSCPSSN